MCCQSREISTCPLDVCAHTSTSSGAITNFDKERGATPTGALPLTPSADATTTSLDALCINTVRTLAMDAVQQADSGHPGAPMGLAPLAYALFTRHLRHNPADPAWPNRDRFVLSNGHASMLLYASLFMSGYDVTLDDLKQFRQWGSRTPGHPEHGHTPGVETTTGPLGQGLANAVGMAVAEAHLAAEFNRDGHAIVDHHTWFIVGDGCLMEGISHEAASFAGHFGLGKLIGFYDDNRISIDGSTDLTFTDDTQRRFEAYGWQVLRIEDVNDLDAIDRAVGAAKADPTRPTLIITRTHIGYGSPNRQDSAKAHGEPLGAAEIALTKQSYGWEYPEPFTVPDEARAHWQSLTARGASGHDAWRRQVIAYTKAFPAEAMEFGRRTQGDLPGGWAQAIPTFTAENGNVASRAASGVVLNALAGKVPELFGGSADLSGSNLTTIKDAPLLGAHAFAGRNVPFGVREHGMAAMMNGMALHGGVIPYGGTFLVFSDYMRPAVRLAALMCQRVIYVFTHDSIGLGEDGPTHQPVEHLSALRCIPNLVVLRPADAHEVAESWKFALTHRTGPTALVLTRQKLPLIDRALPGRGAASGLARGGYVISESAGGPAQLVVMSSGSEVSLALEAQTTLAAKGVRTRVVSVPSMELFAQQDAAWRASVLPPGVPRIAIEAAHPMPWYRLVGDHGTVIGIEKFGASAPYQRIYQEYGITAEHIVRAAAALV
ncbi:MAG: transketolase [Gemmatimonadaceae bacterium]|nr:transketolase [Gemmatimonadaceae bacterium]